MKRQEKYKTIKCRNCGNEFVWSVEEQALYRARKLDAPEYCPICRGMMAARDRDDARKKYDL